MSFEIATIEKGIANLLRAHSKLDKKFDTLDLDAQLTNIGTLQTLNSKLTSDLEKQDFPQKELYLQTLEQEEKALENLFETEIKDTPDFITHTKDKRNIEEAKVRVARKKSGLTPIQITFTNEQADKLISDLVTVSTKVKDKKSEKEPKISDKSFSRKDYVELITAAECKELREDKEIETQAAVDSMIKELRSPFSWLTLSAGDMSEYIKFLNDEGIRDPEISDRTGFGMLDVLVLKEGKNRVFGPLTPEFILEKQYVEIKGLTASKALN